MRALVTAFEPFDRWRVNSSEAAARRLGDIDPSVAVRVLPVDHDDAPAALARALAETRPDALLSTGLADDASPRLELRARTREGADPAPGLWPWSASLDAMRAAGTPSRLSTDAGLYVCETTYRAALAARSAGDGPGLVAFLHLPPVSEAWPVERLCAALRACLSPILR